MLDKKICHKCAIKNNPNYSKGRFNIFWKKEGVVECCVDNKSTLFSHDFPWDIPPTNCPYYLEQTLKRSKYDKIS